MDLVSRSDRCLAQIARVRPLSLVFHTDCCSSQLSPLKRLSRCHVEPEMDQARVPLRSLGLSLKPALVLPVLVTAFAFGVIPALLSQLFHFLF